MKKNIRLGKKTPLESSLDNLFHFAEKYIGRWRYFQFNESFIWESKAKIFFIAPPKNTIGTNLINIIFSALHFTDNETEVQWN
jgi:hypothetical protein